MSARARLCVMLVLVLGSLVPLHAGAAPRAGVGHLDASFANHGRFVKTVATGGGGGTPKDGAVTVRPLSNGEFIVADWADRPGSRDFAILKFHANGTFDKHFGGGDGIVYTDFNGGLDYPDGIAIDSKNRIVVGGCVGPSAGAGCYDFGVARYTPAGKLDTSFGGGDGRVNTDFNGGNDYGNGLVLMPNGDIAVAGSVQGPGSGPTTFGIAMYTPAGALDPAFSGDGRESGLGPTGTGAQGVAVTPDGKLTLVGTLNGDIVLERFMPTGGLDPNYGSGGVETADFGDTENGYSLVAQSNGAVTVAGYATSSGPVTEFLIAHFKPNGATDLNFGTAGGETTTGFGGGDDAFANAIVQEPDGKYVLAGQMLVSGNDNEFAFARYRSDGGLDASFGTNGKAVVSFGSSYDYAYGVGVLNNGDVVGVGQKGYHTAIAALVGDSGPQCTLVGTKGVDKLVGTGGPDVLCGLDSGDTLKGLAGNDFLFGGAGGDTLVGGPGIDTCRQGLGSGPVTSCEH